MHEAKEVYRCQGRKRNGERCLLTAKHIVRTEDNLTFRLCRGCLDPLFANSPVPVVTTGNGREAPDG